MPVHLIKAWFEKYVQRLPSGVDMVYAWGHVIFRDIRWIVEMEWVTQLTDYRLQSFRRWRKLIQKQLTSERCKKIICRTSFNRTHVLRNFDSSVLHEKCVVVPQAVPAKHFIRPPERSGMRILFVGSGSVSGGFEQKGGLVLLEAFRHLRGLYPNLELVVRSDLPPVVNKYRGMPGLRLLEKPLSARELEAEFILADLFAIPAHATPTVILEAMSYGLPVVTTDVYENSEIVEDGKTGFLIPPSAMVKYYADNDLLLPDFDDPGYSQAIARVDTTMVCNLTEKLKVLLENADLRRSLGAAAKEEVNVGRFSIAHRNGLLRGVFDEALDGSRE